MQKYVSTSQFQLHPISWSQSKVLPNYDFCLFKIYYIFTIALFFEYLYKVHSFLVSFIVAATCQFNGRGEHDFVHAGFGSYQLP